MIYVITAVHNRIKTTEIFLNVLMSQTFFSEVQLILVDDGSTDGTYELVKEMLPGSVVLKGNGDLFWGGALNLAFKYLSKKVLDSDIVFYSNDDVFFPHDYLKRAEKLVYSRPNDLLTGCGILKANGEYCDGPVNYNFELGKEQLLPMGEEGNCCSTRSLFMTGKTYKDIGGFHPFLLPHYGSDYEYTIRAVRKGHKVYSSASFIYSIDDLPHKEKKTSTIHFGKGSINNPFQKVVFYLLITPKIMLPKLIINKVKEGRN